MSLMIDISHVDNWDIKTCVEQMDIRRQLIREMVGDLYPRILSSEIKKIHNRKNEIQRSINNGR